MSAAGPEAFGPYLVYEQIGIGGMAQVHRAELRATEGFHRAVALKRMLPHVAADIDMVKSFVREAHLASHLHHANVAQTYELGKVDDIYFIAMELICGRNLREILRQCAATTGLPMPVPVALNIINQICDALDYAHNLCDGRGKPLGIIHRDVSPSNIIVAEGGVVKLIDFGIAKVSASGMQTMSGTIKGKFGYMAPEYLEGSIDARADLFAVGVIAHELLTNRPLFTTPDDMETLKRVRSLDVAPPSKQNPKVPSDIDEIVMTALARDPDKRWQHATALRTAMTTLTHRLGLALGNSQTYEWIEWAFEQTNPRGRSALMTAVIESEDPSIVVSSHTSEITNVTEPRTPMPNGTPQRITAQPASPQVAVAVARYERHDALAPSTGRVSTPNINSTLAGTGPSAILRNPPSASKPPASIDPPPPGAAPRFRSDPVAIDPPPPGAAPRFRSDPVAIDPPPPGAAPRFRSDPVAIDPPPPGAAPRFRSDPVAIDPPPPGAAPRFRSDPVAIPIGRASTPPPSIPPPSIPPPSIPPPSISPPSAAIERPSKPRLRDSAPTFDPPFVQNARIELPTTPLPVPLPQKSSLLVTVVLVLLVAGVAGTAVYFLLPLVT